MSRPRRRLGTAGRLSAALAVLLVLVLGASAFITWFSFSSRATSRAKAEISAQLRDVVRSVSARGAQSIDAWELSYLSVTALPSGNEIVLQTPSGDRVRSQGATPLLSSPPITQLLSHPPATSTISTVSSSNVPVLALASPLVSGGHRVGAVVITSSLAAVGSDQRRVLLLVVAEATLAVVVAVTGTYLVLRRLLGTVGQMTTTARLIEAGDLDRRLGDPGTGDEVAELARTLDEMLDRIDTVVASQRRLLSDVSHQLKTPLTVMRGHLEVLDRTGVDRPADVRRTIGIVVAEIEETRLLVEDLLLLGRSLEPDFLDVAPVDLRELIADLVRAASVLADRDVAMGPTSDVVLEADGSRLRGALLNLVDNAIKATSSGDVIEISARTLDDGSVAISVADSGPGLPAGDRARVLERFGRAETEARPGTGLGLAIVGAVASSHGGTVELRDAALGGLEVLVVLPPTCVVDIDESVEEGL